MDFSPAQRMLTPGCLRESGLKSYTGASSLLRSKERSYVAIRLMPIFDHQMRALRIFKMRSTKRSPWSFSILCLLALYLSVFVKSSAVLPHTHTHHEESAAGENDPCHIAIYHPGQQGACHHKSHLTSAPEDCKLTHLTLVRQSIPQVVEDAISDFTFNSPYYFFVESASHAFQLSFSNRGPPSAAAV